MRVHLLGNGPSRSTFRNRPEGEVFGCNFSNSHYNLTATFVADTNVIVEMNNKKSKIPVIIPTRLEKAAKNLEIYDYIPPLKNGTSTGHIAYEYLKARYREIHLWGFDSLWKDDCESDSPGIRCDDNYIKWRKKWEALIEDFPYTIIHTPAGVTT